MSKLGKFQIALLAIGSPIWLSLLIAVFAVVFSLYISVWAVIISIWSVFLSLIGCVIGGVVSAIIFAVSANGLAGLFSLLRTESARWSAMRKKTPDTPLA